MEESKCMTTENQECLPSPACVIKVGGGRGFVIKHRTRNPQHPDFRLKRFHDERMVITAAHCLPQWPPSHAFPNSWDKTFRLLGNLDGSKSNIFAECLFVNPVADIAVLGVPDEQEPTYDSDAYHDLTDDALVIQMEKARSGPGWVLSLDGHWIPTTIEVGQTIGGGEPFSIGPTEAGMSGSPILNDAGRAVGVVVLGAESNGP